MEFDVTDILNKIPDFNSHEEARSWFNEQFPKRFFLRVHDNNVYYYHLVKNLDQYQQYMESFASTQKHEISNIEPFESYSTVEISEDGGISITI